MPFLNVIFGQSGIQQKDTPTIQPKVMVIPYTKDNQDLLGAYENNSLNRLAISKIKESFDKRNYPTVDFAAKAKMLNNEQLMEIESQTSLKQEIIESSGADVYVEVETTINKSGSGNSVTVICSAYDAFTGVSMANKSGVSNKFYTESFESLIDIVIDEMTDDFLENLQLSFSDIHNNGRLISMNITFGENSEYNMDSEFDEYELLSDLIEKWLESNSFHSYFHIQGVTATKMIVDEIRIPLKTENGSNYRVSQFVQQFRKYLGHLNLDSQRDLQGGKIYITIL